MREDMGAGFDPIFAGLLGGVIALGICTTTWETLNLGKAAKIRSLQSQQPAHPAGATDPRVTQGNIQTTICRYGYTKTVRPPQQYTSALKRHQIASLGLPGTMRDYEEDHLIPLELGGAPFDPNNLWPEPIAHARVKDREENALHAAVCGGRISLSDAQERMREYR